MDNVVLICNPSAPYCVMEVETEESSKAKLPASLVYSVVKTCLKQGGRQGPTPTGVHTCIITCMCLH